MRLKYKVRIVTVTGKVYKISWDMKNATLNSSEHPADAFFAHDHFLVKETDKSETVVPRSAIVEATFELNKDDMSY